MRDGAASPTALFSRDAATAWTPHPPLAPRIPPPGTFPLPSSPLLRYVAPVPSAKETSCPVPVALIIFNRPDLTVRVLDAIRSARPPQLFVIADGPRNDAETALCAQTRALVSSVDWQCELHTNFSDSNMGCGHRPATGIDWVFSQVDQAIILEDDCLPAPSFFQYCAALLARYRDNPRVMHISGNNYLPGVDAGRFSYYFSKYTFSCGWATWRRAWKFYDFGLPAWPKFKLNGGLSAICPDSVERDYWRGKLDPIHSGKRHDAWDYQWNFSVWAQGGLSILPAVNLISNLGFRPDATHTRDLDPRANLPVADIWDIRHPETIEANQDMDRLAFDRVLGGSRLRQRRTLRYRLSKPLRLWQKWGG